MKSLGHRQGHQFRMRTETAFHPSDALEILITLQLCSETVNMLNLNYKANLPINNKANFITSSVIEFQKELNILISTL